MDDIRDALSYIPADDRDLWVRMAMAIKSELGDAGRDLWLDWSSQSERYRPRDALAVWRSIRGEGVTIGTLIHEAKAHGWKGQRLTTVPREHTKPIELNRWSEKAETIWRRAHPLTGSDVASTYLANRKCIQPPEDADLRWMPASERYQYPTMLARVTDAVTGEPMTLHFTSLMPDGSGKAPVVKVKRLLAGHQKRGGVIRLWPTVTDTLALCEGIETALSVAHIQQPVWASVDASNLAAFPVLEGVERLSVYADHDEHRKGEQAAWGAAKRWRSAGREARVFVPDAPGDVNDIVTRLHHGES
jgi:putative DNA primase/helicase